MKESQLYDIIWSSRPLMQAAEASVERGLCGTGLTVRMRAVLEILQKQGSMTVPDLAHHLEIKRQYVQLMVNETIADGLAEQRPNPRHKRSSLIALTDIGQALIEKVTQYEQAIVRHIGAEFSTEEVETTLRVIRRLTDQLKYQAMDDTP